MCHFPHENSDLPYVSNFYKKYKVVYNQPADGPSFSGPIALHSVEVALKKAGRDLTRERFVDALETFENYTADQLGMVPLTYTKKDHTGMTGVYVVQFRKGLYRTVSDKVIDFKK